MQAEDFFCSSFFGGSTLFTGLLWGGWLATLLLLLGTLLLIKFEVTLGVVFFEGESSLNIVFLGGWIFGCNVFLHLEYFSSSDGITGLRKTFDCICSSSLNGIFNTSQATLVKENETLIYFNNTCSPVFAETINVFILFSVTNLN